MSDNRETFAICAYCGEPIKKGNEHYCSEKYVEVKEGFIHYYGCLKDWAIENMREAK